MAFNFPGTDGLRRVRFEDPPYNAARMSLYESAGWTVSGWVSMNSNAGTGFQVLTTYDTYLNTYSGNRFLMTICEDSNADADNMGILLRGGGGTEIDVKGSGGPFAANDTWYWVCLDYDGTTARGYVSDPATPNVSSAYAGDITVQRGWFFGAPDTGAVSNRSLNGKLAEWAAWDYRISATDRYRLSQGTRPSEIQAAGLKWYVPFRTDAEDASKQIELTEVESTVTVTADHPPMRARSRSFPLYLVPAAAAPPSGTAAPVFLHHYNQMRRA